MTRWDRLRAEPERLWVAWNPDGWWVRPEVVALAVMGLLFILAPGFMDLFGPRRRGGQGFLEFLMSTGLLIATVVAFLVRVRRLRRRAALSARLGPSDWVCANCLHAEPERPD